MSFLNFWVKGLVSIPILLVSRPAVLLLPQSGQGAVSIYGAVDQFKKLSFSQEPSLQDAIGQVQLLDKGQTYVWVRHGANLQAIKAVAWNGTQVHDGDVIFVPWNSNAPAPSTGISVVWPGGGHVFPAAASATRVFDLLLNCSSMGLPLRDTRLVVHISSGDGAIVDVGSIACAQGDIDFAVPHEDRQAKAGDLILCLPASAPLSPFSWADMAPVPATAGKPASPSSSPGIPKAGSIIVLGDVDGYPTPYIDSSLGAADAPAGFIPLASLLAKCHGSSADFVIVDSKDKQPEKVYKVDYPDYRVHGGASVFVPNGASHTLTAERSVTVVYIKGRSEASQVKNITGARTVGDAVKKCAVEMLSSKLILYSGGKILELTGGVNTEGIKMAPGDVLVAVEKQS